MPFLESVFILFTLPHIDFILLCTSDILTPLHIARKTKMFLFYFFFLPITTDLKQDTYKVFSFLSDPLLEGKYQGYLPNKAGEGHVRRFLNKNLPVRNDY